MVGLDAPGPVEDDVGGRHQLDLHDLDVERVLAGQERLDPHALAAALDEIAVGEVGAGDVEVLLADVRHHHADVADRDLGERDQLDRREPRVEVPRARQQHLLLQAPAAAGLDEGLGPLEALVPGDRRAGQVTGRDRPTVEDGDDADRVGRDLEDVQVVGGQAVGGGVPGGDHGEDRGVDAVGAGGEDRELPTALTAAIEERGGVLELIAGHRLAEHALGRDRRAVGGDHARDLAGRHRDQRHPLDLVLPAPQREVPAGRQQLGLVAGLAVGRDQAAGRQIAAVALDDQAGLLLADEAEAERDRDEGGRDQRSGDDDPWMSSDEGEHDGLLEGTPGASASAVPAGARPPTSRNHGAAGRRDPRTDSIRFRSPGV